MNLNWLRIGANALVTFGTVGAALYAAGSVKLEIALIAACFQAVIVLGQEIKRECEPKARKGALLPFYTIV